MWYSSTPAELGCRLELLETKSAARDRGYHSVGRVAQFGVHAFSKPQRDATSVQDPL